MANHGTAASERSRSDARTDIQAVRALAVGAVVLFHVWPGIARGGYVGVDVFFVISGFLITGQLLGRIGRTGRVDLADFWSRRVRRLLPLSLVVLVASAVATVTIGADVDRGVHLRSILGSALYVENWRLASDAVDYLASENVPPVAQHYWSLAVEEQFYLVWPLVLVATALVARRTRRATPWMTVVVVCSAASFVASLVLTAGSQPWAFFGTPTRIWEFGAGAALAVSASRTTTLSDLPRRLRSVLGWLGLALVLGASLLFTGATPFPGWPATVPVLGATLMIAAGLGSDDGVLGRAMALRPLQWIGDHSYGIYLWHWPLVVLAPAALGHRPGLAENIGLVVVTVALAAVTKPLVEDRFRFGRRWLALAPSRVLVVAVVSAVVVAGAGLAGIQQIDRETKADARALDRSLAAGDCVGAQVLLEQRCRGQLERAVSADDLKPRRAALLSDSRGAYGCYDSDPSSDVRACDTGSTRSDAVRIAVTGDSHAAMLLPGLRRETERNNWRITAIVGRGCVWSRTTDDDPCAPHRDAVDRLLAERQFDVVVTTAWNPHTPETVAATADGYAQVWQAAIARGTAVVVVADNPRVTDAQRACLARDSTFTTTTCAADQADVVGDDPLVLAAGRTPGATLVDLTDAYCVSGRCPMVVGGVIVYRDEHHVTGSYALTVAPYLERELVEAVRAHAAGRDTEEGTA